MKAIQIVELSGPASALRLAEVPEPDSAHPLTPGAGVTIEVHAAGVSFPELLQTRGLYQLKPPLPFVPGSEVGGVVLSAPDGAGVKQGDRVAAFCGLGAFSERVVAPEFFTFPLPAALDFAQGAGLILNYHTAYFALALRGRVREGEWVLVHGAAGGVGTASLQVAKGLGARTIAVVSSEEKQRIAEEAGAEHVVRAEGAWKDKAKALSDGGVDVVLDPVGGDRFTDSLRCLRENGRVIVVGFTAGSIPEARVNRLLLNNTEIVGAGWGHWAMSHPVQTREIGVALNAMIERGVVRPIVGGHFALHEAAEALQALERREALGKIVLDVR